MHGQRSSEGAGLGDRAAGAAIGSVRGGRAWPSAAEDCRARAGRHTAAEPLRSYIQCNLNRRARHTSTRPGPRARLYRASSSTIFVVSRDTNVFFETGNVKLWCENCESKERERDRRFSCLAPSIFLLDFENRACLKLREVQVAERSERLNDEHRGIVIRYRSFSFILLPVFSLVLFIAVLFPLSLSLSILVPRALPVSLPRLLRVFLALSSRLVRADVSRGQWLLDRILKQEHTGGREGQRSPSLLLSLGEREIATVATIASASARARAHLGSSSGDRFRSASFFAPRDQVSRSISDTELHWSSEARLRLRETRAFLIAPFLVSLAFFLQSFLVASFSVSFLCSPSPSLCVSLSHTFARVHPVRARARALLPSLSLSHCLYLCLSLSWRSQLAVSLARCFLAKENRKKRRIGASERKTRASPVKKLELVASLCFCLCGTDSCTGNYTLDTTLRCYVEGSASGRASEGRFVAGGGVRERWAPLSLSFSQRPTYSRWNWR